MSDGVDRLDKGISAVWRRHRRRDWQPAEIVANHPTGGLVLREVGKFWPGVWLADRGEVRIAGPEFEARS